MREQAVSPDELLFAAPGSRALTSRLHEGSLWWRVGNAKVPSDLERWDLSEGPIHPSRKALSRCRLPARVRRSSSVADGRGVVGHAGARLLADVAEVTGLTSGVQ